MLIGLTGLIGSGKSEVASVFRKLGAVIISGDELGHEVVETDSVVFFRLVNSFGPSIIDKGTRINRRRLAVLAFSSAENTRLLNTIVHPPLLRRLDERIAHAERYRYHAVVDAALLVYWKYHTRMNCTIMISSYSRNRRQRLFSLGLRLEDIQLRERAQSPLAVLRRECDLVLTNNAGLETLRKKARNLYSRLTEKRLTSDH